MKWLLSLSWKVTSVCIKMLNMQTMCSRMFGRKPTETYCSIWAGVVSFCSLFFVLAPHRRCCLCNEVRPTEGEAPLATGFYNLKSTILYSVSGIFDFKARHDEVGVFWHLQHQGIKFRHLFCKKKFLEKIINLRVIKELADLGKIHVKVPKTRSLQVCPKSADFSENLRVLDEKSPLDPPAPQQIVLLFA